LLIGSVAPPSAAAQEKEQAQAVAQDQTQSQAPPEPQTRPHPVQQTIVVVGTFEPIPLEQADRPVDVIDVRKLGLVSNSLVDFLRLDPSIDLGERGPDGTQADISIRGGTFEQTLVLLNGFRMNNAQTGHHDMDLPVPVDALSNVEILRGSGSTIYGSDAIDGVVNFITQAPEATEVKARTAVGNFGINQQSASITTVFENLTEQMAFSRDFSTGFMTDRDYRNLEFFSNTHFTSRFGPTDVVLATNDRPFGANQFYGPYDSWERTRTWFASLRQSLGTKTEASFAFRKHTDEFVLFRDDPQFYANHHWLHSYQAALRRREKLSENARLFYGVEGFQDSIVSNNLGDHTRGRVAAYVDFDERAWRRLSFSIGVREEIYRSVRGEFVPAMDAGYWINTHLKLRGGVSRSFRVPSMTDLYYSDPTTIGSSSLIPETAWSAEGGLDWNAGAKVSGEVTVFNRWDHNLIDYVLNSSAIWQAANIPPLRFFGVETALKTKIKATQDLEIRFTAIQGFRNQLGNIQTRYTFNYPVDSGVVSWQGSLPHGFLARSRLGILYRYNRDPYALWDLYFARGGGRIHPFLQLTNVTNTSYQEIIGVQMPGRTIVGGVEFILYTKKN
jgi:iron complex outermembrane receptor protein